MRFVRTAGKTPARFAYDRIMPRLLRSVRPQPVPADVLDAGCGDGQYSRWFSGDRYTGIDLGDNLPCATDGRRFIKGSILEMPLGEETFDIAFCSLVLEHVPDVPATFRALRHRLRPGGVLVLSTASQWTTGLGEMPHLFWRLDRDSEGGAYHYFKPEDLVQACRAAGFKRAETRYIGGPFGLMLEYVWTFLTYLVYRLIGFPYVHGRDSIATGQARSPKEFNGLGRALLSGWRMLTVVPAFCGNWIAYGLDRLCGYAGPAKVIVVIGWTE